MVKFDEKTLAAERRIYPFVIIVSLLFLLVGVLLIASPAAFSLAVGALGIGVALFSAGAFWFVDRWFHEDD